MNYVEAKKYLDDITKYGSVLGLESITSLMEILGNPQDKLKVVHFAGTNGKGSTMAFVESILKSAGYKVGKYTSPAVFEYREIIKVDGKLIEEEAYAGCMKKVKGAIGEMIAQGLAHPTSFEVETAIAFLYFLDSKCDVVLLETGMGGETDATNVVKDVLCSVITSIGIDHTGFLGNTIEDITRVKAGIIKENSYVVKGIQEKEVLQEIHYVAAKKRAKVIIANEPFNINADEELKTVFDYKGDNIDYSGLKISMLGKYQTYNAVIAIEAIQVLINRGYNVSEECIREGLLKATNPGRFEIINYNPLFIIDGAHNPQGAKALRETLQMYFTNKRIAFIMGVLSDKDYDQVAKQVINLDSYVVTTTPVNNRALKAKELEVVAKKYCDNVESTDDIAIAVDKAVCKVNKGEADLIVAFGTLSFLKNIKYYVKADC